MPTKKAPAPAEIYQIKVTLLRTDPPVWRRLLVPAQATLAHLHDVLQATMGWENDHLHEFSVGKTRFGAHDPMGAREENDECTVPLSSVLVRVGSKAIYTYDFGDEWEHGIVLEKRLPVDPNLTYPLCTAGERACPPEDCGGIYGYYDLVEAIGDPDHDRHEEMLDWIGEYDPEAFSLDEVNRALLRFQRRRKAARG
jgi:hypothetical protein